VTGASREAVVRLAVSREAAMVSDFSVSVITGLPQSVATLLVLTYELIAGRAWIVLAGGLGLFVLSRLLADRASRRVGGARRELTAADAVVFGSLSEHIKASEDLRLWGARDQAVAEFSEVAHACAKARARFAAALAVSGQIKRVVTAMSPLLIIVAVTVAGGEFDAGEVAKLLLLVPLLMSRLEALDGIRQGNFERGPMIDATVKLLRLPPAPVRAVDARRLDLAQVKGEVAFDAVGFTPPGTTACVLDDVSIHIPAGAVVGICGPSGSGKSTLLRLLLRLDDPTTGMVRLDDTDVRLVEPAQLPDLFGVVRQTSSLLQRAVRENLSLGLDPPPDDDAMRAALERVHLDDLADPRGRRDLDTAYRANPPNFSGGECRRLLIARMLLSPAPVLALDEPEAGLPSATAEDILMAIAGAANGRTTLVVTHAPHLLDSDFNVVLDAGRVAAMGKHEELVEQSETYRQLLADAVVGGS